MRRRALQASIVTCVALAAASLVFDSPAAQAQANDPRNEIGPVLCVSGCDGPARDQSDGSRRGDVSTSGAAVTFDTDLDVFGTPDTPDDNGVKDIVTYKRDAGSDGTTSIASAADSNDAPFPVGDARSGPEHPDAEAGASLTATGQYVAFESAATNLAPPDPNNGTDIFRREINGRDVERVSVAAEGGSDEGDSTAPSISDDGRVVAFESTARLVPEDTNDVSDIYVRDLAEGTTELISAVPADGADGESTAPAISGDGRFVVFLTEGDLVPEQTDENTGVDIVRHDRATGRRVLVSVDWKGNQPTDERMGRPHVSDDGNLVVFGTAAPLDPADEDDGDGVWDVHLRDIARGTTTKVSRTHDGSLPDDEESSDNPTISGNGRFIAFVSRAPILPHGQNPARDLYVFDRATGSYTRASTTADGSFASTGGAFRPALSDDGRYVVFDYSGSELLRPEEEDTNDTFDVVLRDRALYLLTATDVSPRGSVVAGRTSVVRLRVRSAAATAVRLRDVAVQLAGGPRVPCAAGDVVDIAAKGTWVCEARVDLGSAGTVGVDLVGTLGGVGTFDDVEFGPGVVSGSATVDVVAISDALSATPVRVSGTYTTDLVAFTFTATNRSNLPSPRGGLRVAVNDTTRPCAGLSDVVIPPGGSVTCEASGRFASERVLDIHPVLRVRGFDQRIGPGVQHHLQPPGPPDKPVVRVEQLGDGRWRVRWDEVDFNGKVGAGYLVRVKFPETNRFLLLPEQLPPERRAGRTFYRARDQVELREVLGTLPAGRYEVFVVAVNTEGEETRSDVVSFEVTGYWLLEEDGDVHTFGGAPDLGDVDLPPGVRAVSIAARPGGGGYWVLASDGEIHARGDAPDFGALHVGELSEPDERPSTMSATPDGRGLWVFTTAGRIRSFGSAIAPGQLRGAAGILELDLDGPIIDSVATASGRGTYMIGSDGGVFTAGDAVFVDSVRGVLTRLLGPPGLPDRPVAGIVADPDGDGYWMVAEDGGVFGFRAPFRGSLPEIVPVDRLEAPVNGMVPYGNGYLLIASDGGVFAFSDLPFAGSAAGTADSPIVGIATTA